MIDKGRLMDTFLEILAVPGISGTESENLTVFKVHDIMGQMDYFKRNSDGLKLIKLENDSCNRHFVAALLKGTTKSRKTIILLGHTDVVDIEEYGHLKHLAFNPIEFTKRVKELKLDSEALADLESGDWLFGRGVNDMKFGVALNIELMRGYSMQEELDGNILFLGVPGEESNSEGMLGAVKYLEKLQREEGYEFTSLLLTEPYGFKSAKDQIRYMQIGACGKIMPMFFFAGKETHAAEPYDGLDPILLASEVNRLISLNTDFCETSRGAVTPPPICLRQVDLKGLYSVQTPLYTASYYNIITLNRSSVEILDMLKELCKQAADNVTSLIEESCRKYEKTYGLKVYRHKLKLRVVTYSEIYESVKKLHGVEFDAYLEEKIREWEKQGLDNQTKAINIVKEIYERYPEKDPMIIIAFEPPYYPGVYPDESSSNMKKLMKVVDSIIKHGQSLFGETFQKEDYYMGISDLSYTGLKDDSGISSVYENMPGAGRIYELPVESLKQLGIPGVVIGPHGKDAHKYTERLNIKYSVGVLPEVMEYAIDSLLEE
ncbi:MAG: M20/M25/M40 family metallo-hydrolase [Caulobacteraceae bacterium]